jgi:hypothetical protein
LVTQGLKQDTMANTTLTVDPLAAVMETDNTTTHVPTLRYKGKEMDINALMLAKMPYKFDAPRENEGTEITDQEVKSHVSASSFI